MRMLRIGDAYVELDAIVALLGPQQKEGWQGDEAEMNCTVCLMGGHQLETESTCEEVLALMAEEAQDG